jgi:exonuclease VII large subunit
MNCSRLVSLLFLLSLALCLAACSARPTEQIDRAEKAKKLAADEHADFFAPDDWKAAETAYNDAQKKLEQEKYGDAQTLLLRAKVRYEKARDLAKGKRVDTVREIQGIQGTADARCKTLKESIDKGSKKLSAKRKGEFEAICKELEEKIAKSKTSLDNAKFDDAKYQAQTVLREVYETQKELDSAVGGKK